MVTFEKVHFSYDRTRPVIEDLSFQIQKGESVGLIGANGAGKSTILKLLLGLLFGDGKIMVGGLEMNTQNLAAIRKQIGFLLQNSDNQMFMPTVYEDMMFAPLNYMLSREEADRRVDAVLERLGIAELKKRYNHTLSGGEKKMAAIATILCLEPKTIVMDEPTSTLDPYHRRIVIRTVQELDQTKLIASHDLDMIWDTTSRVLLLSNGQIVADGPTQTILRDEKLLLAHHLELPLRFSRM